MIGLLGKRADVIETKLDHHAEMISSLAENVEIVKENVGLIKNSLSEADVYNPTLTQVDPDGII